MFKRDDYIYIFLYLISETLLKLYTGKTNVR